MTTTGKETFEEYLRLKGGVKCVVAGREMGDSAMVEELKSADPMRRERAWGALESAWAGKEAELAPLLERSLRAAKFRRAYEAFGTDAGPLLAGAHSVRDPLLRALEIKAGSIGVPDGRFHYSDLWAQVPADSDHGFPLAEGLKRLWGIFDRIVEGGAGFAMQFFPGGRLILEGETPLCRREPGGEAVVYLPETFSSLHLYDLPAIAHELGHALHCDLCSRAGLEIRPQFAETLSQLFEEAVWKELCSEGGAAAGMRLDRLSQLAADLLLVPSMLEFEERACAAAAAGPLDTRTLTELDKELSDKWFSLPPGGFWMRSARLFNPAMPFDGFVYLSGRLLAIGLSSGERISAESLDGLVKDTAELDLNGFLSRRFGMENPAADSWASLLAPVRELLGRIE